MKKAVAFILTVILFAASLSVIPVANAASAKLSASGGGNITPGQTFTISLKVSSDFDVSALVVGLSYDSSKLTRGEVKGANGFAIVPGERIVCSNAAGKKGSFTVFTVVFRAKSAFNIGETTTIKFTGGEIAGGTTEITGASASVKVSMTRAKSSNNNLESMTVNGALVSGFSAGKTTYDLGSTDDTSISIDASADDAGAKVSGTGAFNLEYNKNTFNVIVTAENGATKTYKITINRNDPRSRDNSLASLTASPAEFSFDPEILAYTLFVENEVTSITIDAKVADALATVEGTGVKELEVYSNIFELAVTAENETVRIYRLNIVRRAEDGSMGALSADNKLRVLAVEDYDLSFNPDVLEYGITVPNDVSEISVSAVANNDKASVVIIQPDTLEVGTNLIKVVVTAESTGVRTYTVIVTRKDETVRTSIADLDTTLEDNSTAPSLTLEITDDANELTADVMGKLKNSGKSVAVEKYVDNKLAYKWEFDGSAIVEPTLFNTYISMNSQQEGELEALADYAKVMCLDFAHSGELPAGTKLTVYVGDRFLDGSTVNLYRLVETQTETEAGVITQQSFEPIANDLLVSGGYVTMELSHCSKYIITRAMLTTDDGPFDLGGMQLYILIACGLLLISTIVFAVLYAKEKKRKNTA